MVDMGYDDEATPLVVATITPGIKEDTAERKPTSNTAVKFIVALVGMLAIGSLVFVISGNDDRSSTVALVNRKDLNPVTGDVKECPNECQYQGTQKSKWVEGGRTYDHGMWWPGHREQGTWSEVGGRKCCRDAGQDICHLNGYGNTCNCNDGAAAAEANGDTNKANDLREPCYIDTRCNPFQTVQDGKCKGKPGTVCDNAFTNNNPDDYCLDAGICTEGYECCKDFYQRTCQPTQDSWDYVGFSPDGYH